MSPLEEGGVKASQDWRDAVVQRRPEGNRNWEKSQARTSQPQLSQGTPVSGVGGGGEMWEHGEPQNSPLPLES